MVSVRGYFTNNKFISEENIEIPENTEVIVTILDNAKNKNISESERQRKIFEEFFADIKADDEILPPVFDEII